MRRLKPPQTLKSSPPAIMPIPHADCVHPKLNRPAAEVLLDEDRHQGEGRVDHALRRAATIRTMNRPCQRQM
jgi:hypothetical protein